MKIGDMRGLRMDAKGVATREQKMKGAQVKQWKVV